MLGLELVEHLADAAGVEGHVDLALVAGEDGVPLGPGARPVDLLRDLVARALDGLLDLGDVEAERDELVERRPVGRGEALGLADVGERLVRLPLPDRLARHAQALRDLLLGEAGVLSRVEQAASEHHCLAPFFYGSDIDHSPSHTSPAPPTEAGICARIRDIRAFFSA